MSRFDASRRSRILTWTGAAVAWGTVVTIAGLESDNAVVVDVRPTMIEIPATQIAAMPNPPARGLVILRYKPSAEASPEVRTVYVRQQTAPASTGPVAATPPPAPRSSGS